MYVSLILRMKKSDNEKSNSGHPRFNSWLGVYFVKEAVQGRVFPYKRIAYHTHTSCSKSVTV